jgi:hypothetical protein
MLCTKGSENVAKLEQGKTNYANYAMHKRVRDGTKWKQRTVKYKLI